MKLIDWLLDYKKHLSYTLPVLLLVFVIVFRFSMKGAQAEGDFVAAKISFAEVKRMAELNEQTIDQLKKLLSKHPELQPTYDDQLTQKFLALGEAKEAKVYFDRASQRCALPETYSSRYAKTSMVIANGEFEKGLNEALELKEEMLSDEKFMNAKENSTLVAFNQLRIASLYQKLNLHDKEKAAWNEIKQGLEKTSHGYQVLLSHFSDREVSLLDYIKYREQNN